MFQIDETVVYPACGIGRIVALVTKRFSEAEAHLYYEIVVEKSTVWVLVDNSVTSGLRSLTTKQELAHYRGVLRSQPVILNPNPYQRRLELQSRLKLSSFQDLCEVVRDLTAQSWRKALGEADKLVLRKAREGLCHEWALVEEISLVQAMEQVDTLLREMRLLHQAQPPD